jgi:DNA-directed RNA polymerases I, II, and III subunit RPABC2
LVEALDNKYIDNTLNEIKPENVPEPSHEQPAKNNKKNSSSKTETKTTKSRSKSRKTKTTATTTTTSSSIKEEIEGNKQEKEKRKGEEKSQTKEEIEQEPSRKEKFVVYEEEDFILREIATQGQQILIGPKRLTRFEKARITGARSLQISFGAPLMIKADVKARSSISLAIEELEKKALPISIRRILPNGLYQDVPITWLKI